MNDSVVQSSVMSKRVVTQSWVTSVIMEAKPMVSQTHCMMSASNMCHPMMTHAHIMRSNSMVPKPKMTQTHPMKPNSMVPNTNTMVSMACSKMDNWMSTSMHCMMDRFNMLDHWFWMHYMVVLMHMDKGLEGRQVLLGVSKGWHGVGCH